MYAAVTSRTAEIGTLRALGFSRGAILLSFLERVAAPRGRRVRRRHRARRAGHAGRQHVALGRPFSMMTFSVATVLLQSHRRRRCSGLVFALAIGALRRPRAGVARRAAARRRRAPSRLMAEPPRDAARASCRRCGSSGATAPPAAARRRWIDRRRRASRSSSLVAARLSLPAARRCRSRWRGSQPCTAAAASPTAVPVLVGRRATWSAPTATSRSASASPGRIDRYLVEEGDAREGRATRSSSSMRATTRPPCARSRRSSRSRARTAALKEKQHGARAHARRLEGHDRATSSTSATPRPHAADAGVQQAEAELASARVALEYTTLRAPRQRRHPGEAQGGGRDRRAGRLLGLGRPDPHGEPRGSARPGGHHRERARRRCACGQRAEVVPDAYPDRQLPRTS